MESVVAHPLYADAWTNLAWLYLDEHRYGHNRIDAPLPPLDRAIDAARKALTLQPDDARAHLVMAILQFFKRDLERFEQHAGFALTLNENDPVVAAELGLRFGLQGEWERALPLLDRVVRREPIKWQMYRLAYAFHDIETGNYAAALDELRSSRIADHAAVRAARASVYGHLGRIREAREEWQSVARVIPEFTDAPRFWFADRGTSPRLICGLMEGLDKAGALTDN